VNEAYNHRRWFSRHQRQEIALGREEGLSNYADSSPIPRRLRSIRRPTMRARLSRKGARKSESEVSPAVVLRDIEDLSYEEIAAVLEISLAP